MRHTLRYLAFLVRTNLRTAGADRWSLFWSFLFMTVNNLAWFMIWVLLFGAVGSVRGWGLADVAHMAGIVTFAYGLALVLFGGAWRMDRLILDGTLDIYLTQPKPVLPGVMLSQPDMESLGDMIAGAVILVLFGQAGWQEAGLALLLGILSAFIILGITIMLNSVVFWTQDRSGIMEQILDTFVQISTTPIQGLPLAIKVFLFTVLPVGFIAFLPADILREFSWWKLGVLAAAAVMSCTLAAWIFHRGLRRYTSGSRIVDMR
ncbi:MAG: ABC-2 family transporter protein [Pseudomonadota bacterium]|nr:ABC-2 family transporter protein [Pseudomonadota bacterium]